MCPPFGGDRKRLKKTIFLIKEQTPLVAFFRSISFPPSSGLCCSGRCPRGGACGKPLSLLPFLLFLCSFLSRRRSFRYSNFPPPKKNKALKNIDKKNKKHSSEKSLFEIFALAERRCPADIFSLSFFSCFSRLSAVYSIYVLVLYRFSFFASRSFNS